MNIRNAFFRGEKLILTTTTGQYEVEYTRIRRLDESAAMKRLRKRFPGKIY